MAIASGADLRADLAHGATMSHVIKEGVIVGTSLIAMSWLLLGLRQQNQEIRRPKHELETRATPKNQPGKYVLEKTVRQQASSLYKKADVSGRHAFSAWFIEDILWVRVLRKALKYPESIPEVPRGKLVRLFRVF